MVTPVVKKAEVGNLPVQVTADDTYLEMLVGVSALSTNLFHQCYVVEE